MEQLTINTLVNAYIQAANLSKSTAYCVNRDGHILYASDALLNLLQYQKNTLPETIFEIAPSTSLLSWRKYWEQFDQKERVEEQATLMSKQEQFFEVNSIGCRVENNGETFCYIYFEIDIIPNVNNAIGTFIDLPDNDVGITERIAAFTLEHAREMVFLVTVDGDIIYVNQRAVDAIGFSKTELMKRKAWEYSSLVRTAQEWSDFFNQIKKDGQFSAETEQFRKDGQLNYINTISTYFNFEGTEYIFSIAFDITKRKMEERILERMKYSTDQASEMIAWVNREGKFIYTNARVEEENGYDKDELEDMYLWSVDTKIAAEDWENLWHNFKKRTEMIPYESNYIRKDGSVYPVKVSGSYFLYEDTEYLYVKIENMTGHYAKEQELQRAFDDLQRVKKQLESERNYLQQEITIQHNFNEIITRNKRYKRILQQIQQVAATSATVLILGETGTGKELVARAIHNLSLRRERAIIKINCASLPANLIESELFGHEKGAFTGAYKKKIGRFELADQGTVFLDEIGEMPVDLQSKLLRALQEGEFERVGGTDTIKADVRVIAATNRNLEEMVQNGSFREDLYYRLNVFPIENLPLRERADDIPLLVKFFTERLCRKLGRGELKVSEAAINQLMNYSFPGNIRELENMIERSVILSTGNTLNVQAAMPQLRSTHKKETNTQFLSFEEMQKQHITAALEKTNWKITGRDSAAEILQMNGKTLASRIKKLNIVKSN